MNPARENDPQPEDNNEQVIVELPDIPLHRTQMDALHEHKEILESYRNRYMFATGVIGFFTGLGLAAAENSPDSYNIYGLTISLSLVALGMGSFIAAVKKDDLVHYYRQERPDLAEFEVTHETFVERVRQQNDDFSIHKHALASYVAAGAFTYLLASNSSPQQDSGIIQGI